MKRNFRNILTLTVAIGAFLIGLAPQAHAAATMALCLTDVVQSGGNCVSGNSVYITSDGTVGGTTTQRTGNAPGTVTVNALGISYNGNIGTTWIVNVTTGLHNVSGIPNLMDLNSVDQSSGAGTLNIYWEALGFAAGNNKGYTAHNGGTLSGPITVQIEDCVENTDPGLNIAFCGFSGTPTIGSSTFNASPFSSAFSNTLNNTGGGLLQHLTLTATGVAQTSGDYNLTAAVPEPTSISLLGGVLLLSAGALRRKMRRT